MKIDRQNVMFFYARVSQIVGGDQLGSTSRFHGVGVSGTVYVEPTESFSLESPVVSGLSTVLPFVMKSDDLPQENSL